MGEAEDLFDAAETLYQQRLLERDLAVVEVTEDVINSIINAPINPIPITNPEDYLLEDFNVTIVQNPFVEDFEMPEPDIRIPEPIIIPKIVVKPSILTKKVSFTDIEEALTAIYGNDWSVVPQSLIYDRVIDDNYYKHYAIKYADITITNTSGQSHNIKDLYVVFGVKNYGSTTTPNLRLEAKIYGLRATVTTKEKSSQYRHSHLNANSSDVYHKKATPFCVGTNSTISIAIAELSLGITIDKFELFLYQLQTFVRHESIEGGPYIRIENIGKNGSSSLSGASTETCLAHLKEFLERYKDASINIPFTSYNNVHIVNKGSNELIELVKPFCTKWCIKTLQGDFINAVQQDNVYNNDFEMFIFNKEVVKYTVIADESEAVVELLPHPGILGYIASTLQKEMDDLLILKTKYEYS